MWKTIQRKANNGRPLQLLLDMKVRWSSTFLMLDRAERKRDVCTKFHVKDSVDIRFLFPQCIDTFIDELRWEEQDSTKHDKIRELKLMREEWERVDTFLGLLSVCYVYSFHLHIEA